MFGFLSFYALMTFILSVVYSFLPTNIKKSKQLYMCFACILLFFSFFRAETVGGDLKNYLNVFDNVAELNSISKIYEYSVISGYEFGFALLAKASSYILCSHRFFIVVTSLLSLIGPLLFFYKTSQKPIYSILIYLCFGFYNITMNSVRQSIAISIVLIAYYLLLSDKKKSFLLMILLASTVHISAIFSLVVYFFKMINVRKKNLFLLLLLCILLFFVGGNYLIDRFVFLFFTKYADSSSDALLSGTGYGLFSFYMIIFIFCLYLYNENYQDNSIGVLNKFLILCLFVAIIIQFSSTMMATLTRLTYYFFIVVCVAIPNFIKTSKITVKKKYSYYALAYIALYLFMCLFPMRMVPGLNVNVTDTIPYLISFK